MKPMFVFLFILFFHWIADFIVQTRWQGDNKSKDWMALATHVFTYSVFMAWGLLIAMIAFFLTQISAEGVIIWTTVNGLLHFATDAVTSRMSARAFQKKDMVAFWAIIGFDQWLHQAALAGTLWWLLRGV